MSGFGERVRGVLAERGPLCVGIDPHPGLLAEWGVGDTAAGAREFGLRVCAAASAAGAGIVKPQVSFFERFGSAGMAALESVLAEARASDLVVIADAKRGDIGSTMDAYARAWLTPGSPLEADALTVNPYLGVGTLADAADLASSAGKGLFVLVATSNPEGAALQRARTASGHTVSRAVLDEVADLNAGRPSPVGREPDEWGSVGVVIGATVSWPDAGIAAMDPVAPILAPGFGFQGAQPEDLASIFGASAPAVIASESRSILAAGPERLEETIRHRSELYGSRP